ncbi:MAG: L-2-hydroxyglutarate oxidase [Ignavibacterium sp.]|jgi:L-2-hydroxyglutarate oxidase|nr:L-2-hydroxyglutarate oxidase [Ignavibacterium sp.]
MNINYDITIIGGGIVGTATALSILKEKNVKLLLLEAESSLAAHQTGNNSGVIHSGLYYKPGSLKAANCTLGREMMYTFCKQHNIPFDKCGKIVIATSKEEIPYLNMLEERGKANGLTGIKRISADEIKQHEPHANGIDGLFVPQTGIVDYVAVTNKYAELIEKAGGVIKINSSLVSVRVKNDELILTTNNEEFRTKFIVNCGGLQSDRVAKLCGVDPGLMIIPFRGEYYKIKKEKQYLVKNLIYPVPDINFPFLGVHFTRMIDGEVEAGPNAVLAFKREGYKKTDFSFADLLEMKLYPGFWKMAAKFYKMGFQEFRRSFSKELFVKSLQKLIPKIQSDDIEAGGAGVRAQALERDGKLVDDFRIVEAERMVHVLNAPSPAATASLSIGKTISEMVIKRFNEEVK